MCVSPLRLRLIFPRHTPKLARLTRRNRTRLALLWFSKAACTVRAPGVRSRRPPPPRLSRVFACLDCPSRPRACVFAKIWLLWGCSRDCAGLGVDTRTRPRCPPAANACWICFWSVASCLCPLPLFASFCFPGGGKRTTRTRFRPKSVPSDVRR